VRQQDGELLAPEPGRLVDATDPPAQDLGEGAQHLVAGLVPELVVDVLEVVEVGEDQGEPVPEPLCTRELRVERLAEGTAIREARQLVGHGLTLDDPVQPRVVERDRGLGNERMSERDRPVVEPGRQRMQDQGQLFPRHLRAGELQPQRRPRSLEASLARDLLTAADGDACDRSGRFHRGVEDDREEPVWLVRVRERVRDERRDPARAERGQHRPGVSGESKPFGHQRLESRSGDRAIWTAGLASPT